MDLTDHARRTAQHLLDTFASGQIPKALATVFINHHRTATPSSAWSWNNQLLMVLQGTADGRGFRQWREVGRHVKSGATAIYILVPMIYPIRGDEKPNCHGKDGTPLRLTGFKACPVFRIEDTDGQPLPDGLHADTREWLNNLPLREVAETWGLSITTFDGSPEHDRGHFAWTRPSSGAPPHGVHIAMGVKSTSTWFHELVHAADLRLGHLGGPKDQRQDPHSEIVAELGALTLCHLLDLVHEADPGGTWTYIQDCATTSKREPLAIAQELLDRTAETVSLILETASTTQIAREGIA